jgi:hypothetical protein
MLLVAITVCFLGTLIFLGYTMSYKMMYDAIQYCTLTNARYNYRIHRLSFRGVTDVYSKVCRMFSFGSLFDLFSTNDEDTTASDVDTSHENVSSNKESGIYVLLDKVFEFVLSRLFLFVDEKLHLGIKYNETLTLLQNLMVMFRGVLTVDPFEEIKGVRIMIPDSRSAEQVLQFSQTMTIDTCRELLRTADLLDAHIDGEQKSLADMGEEDIVEEITALSNYPVTLANIVNNQSPLSRLMRLQVVLCVGYAGYQELCRDMDEQLIIASQGEWTEMDTSDTEDNVNKWTEMDTSDKEDNSDEWSD